MSLLELFKQAGSTVFEIKPIDNSDNFALLTTNGVIIINLNVERWQPVRADNLTPLINNKNTISTGEDQIRLIENLHL